MSNMKDEELREEIVQHLDSVMSFDWEKINDKDREDGYKLRTADRIMQLIKADREAAVREAEASFERRDKNARLQELLDLENNGQHRTPAYLKKRIRRLRQQLVELKSHQPTKEGK